MPVGGEEAKTLMSPEDDAAVGSGGEGDGDGVCW